MPYQPPGISQALTNQALTRPLVGTSVPRPHLPTLVEPQPYFLHNFYQGTTTTAGATSLAVSLSVVPNVNQLLYASIRVAKTDASDPLIAIPTDDGVTGNGGWKIINPQQRISGQNIWTADFWKVADAGETTLTFTFLNPTASLVAATAICAELNGFPALPSLDQTGANNTAQASPVIQVVMKNRLTVSPELIIESLGVTSADHLDLTQTGWNGQGVSTPLNGVGTNDGLLFFAWGTAPLMRPGLAGTDINTVSIGIGTSQNVAGLGATFLDPTIPWSNPQHVQGTMTAGTTTTGAVSITTPKKGQLLVVSMMLRNNTSGATYTGTITDSAGGTWTQVPGGWQASGASAPFESLAAFYKQASGTETTVTLTWTVSAGSITATSCYEIDEFDGFHGIFAPALDINGVATTGTGAVTTVSAAVGTMKTFTELTIGVCSTEGVANAWTGTGCYFGTVGNNTQFTLNTQANNLAVGWCAGHQ